MGWVSQGLAPKGCTTSQECQPGDEASTTWPSVTAGIQTSQAGFPVPLLSFLSASWVQTQW